MLRSIVAELEAEEAATIPATHGEAMQAAFLQSIGAFDPALRRLLHSTDANSPAVRAYTLSPLVGKFTARQGRLTLAKGPGYWFRVTGLDETMDHALLQLTGHCSSWRVLDCTFAVRRWCTRPDEHAWAGALDPEDMVVQAARDACQSPNRIRLRFFSPTAFCLRTPGRGHRWEHPPAPRLVFGGLARRLLSFVPHLRLRQSLQDVVKEFVAVGEMEIQTRAFFFGRHNGHVAGAVGMCEYLLLRDMVPERRLFFHLLAAFAFYSGVGSRTVWGMGQTRREPVYDFTYRGK